MVGNRIWLDVPYADKDVAKAQGARWDTAARRWYAPLPDAPALERWMALPDIPDLLPGEDRSFGAGLFVDLVPRSCWFTNARSCVSDRDWERLRRTVVARAGQRCEVCHRPEDRASGRRLEAHERWSYDSAALVQSLRRLICVCTNCHEVTHFGLANIKGKSAAAMSHLCDVTGMSRQEAKVHVDAAFDIWEARSRATWTLDLGMLTGVGVRVRRPPSPGERARASAPPAR